MPKQKLTKKFIESVENNKSYTVEYFDTECSGLILNVTNKGTKSFSYRYKDHSTQKRLTFGRYPEMSIREARNKTARAKYDNSVNRDPRYWEQRELHENEAEKVKQRKQKTIERSTIKELAEKFKELYMPQLRESTRTTYWQVLKSKVFPVIGHVSVYNIDKKQILNLLDTVAIKDGNPATANKIRTVLSKMFNWGKERDLIEKNYINETSSYSAGTVKRERFFNDKEIKKIWKSLSNLHHTVTPYFFKMLFLTGQRRTETRKMKWDNLDFKNKIWSIPAEDTKNKTNHSVPLSTYTIQLLKELKDYSGGSKYVFESPRKKHKGKPISTVKRSKEYIRTYTEIEDFRPHDIRRTVATNMAKLGIQRTVVGKILNHKGLSGDSSVTAIYDRFSYMEQKADAINKWTNRLIDILNK